LRNLVAGLQDDELLTGDQSEHCIGCGLGVFDEVAVDGERTAVETCQFNHVWSSFQGLSSAGKLLSIGDIDGRPVKIEQKWNSSKVHEARADEVGERGAFRMVNRISRAAVSAI
jgi:hypothetical protein